MALVRPILSALLAGLLCTAGLGAQDRTGTVAGRVVDSATQQPLAGVTVTVGARGALTGADGRFSVSAVPAGQRTVQARRLGYQDATLQLSVVAGQTASVEIAMTAQAVALEGVVAVGYGSREVREVTGSVAAVSAEEFNTGRVVSPEELIQGKVAGVQIVDSGEPGGGVSIRIRGGTSVNASNEPLFVIDGVPLPPGGGLSAGRNPLNFLNPEDIESITILKDASSTAIYGSRGANGVVLVQTKQGRDTQMTYTGSVSGSTASDGPDLLSADQFRAVVAERAPNQMQYLGNADTDWRDAVLQNARGQEHSVAVAGAGQSMNYRLSLGFLEQEGVLQGTTTERVSAAINYNHRLFADRLNLRASLRGSRTDDQFTPGGVLGAATGFDPTQPIRTESGFFEQTRFVLAPNNPVAEVALVQDEGTTYRNLANVEGEYRFPFLEALTATARLGYDVAKSERRIFVPTFAQSQVESDLPGFLSRSNPTETTGILETFLNYSTRLDRAESELDATAGYSYESSRGDYPYFQARGLSSDLLGPSGVPSAEEYRPSLFVRESRLASFFARVNYSLRDRYLLTLSVRRDGSSRFGPGNQWGTFPAAALAWRISEESFMQGYPALSDLKLRASWGVNGNQAIGDYLWVADYRYSDDFARAQFGDEFVTTIRPTAVDPNIKWEETTSFNLGVDYGFLDNRITGALEYYRKDTDDLIFRVPVAAGAFVSNRITTNIGSVRNEGVELSVNTLLLDGAQGGLSWNASFNAAANRNRLQQINPFGGGGEQILVGGIAGGVGSTIQVLRPGYAVNTFLVYRHKRDASGRPINSDDLLQMYEDVNGDGVINQDDRTPFENPTPNWILGHSSQLGYGNLDLSFTLRAHLGNHVYNNLASSRGYYNRLNEAAGPVNLHASVLENGFVEPQFFSDVYLEDASFLRMDNLTLGYRLPRTRGVRSMRIFGTVENVFTLTGYSGTDPEAGLGGIDNNLYPRSRTLTIGANVGF